MKYFITYKPFNMLCQFSPDGEKKTLSHLGSFPKDVYPVGRLDADSEGLLILTNDGALNHALLNPSFKHHRIYAVQVEGTISSGAVQKLCKGVSISVGGISYKTKPAFVKILKKDPVLPERIPSIRHRNNIPTSWIEIKLCEGKNRQVRKMTAAVGFPTLRLVRVGIQNIRLGKMKPGEVKQKSKKEIYGLLFT